jgi:hypothetical protein
MTTNKVAGTSSGSITHNTVSVRSKTVECQFKQTIHPSDSLRLEKSNHVMSVLFVGEKRQPELWF